MLIYFSLFKVDEGFCLLHEFLFYFSSADLKVKTERVKLRGLMLSPCVKGSKVETSPTSVSKISCVYLLKTNFYSLNIRPFWYKCYQSISFSFSISFFTLYIV